MFAVLFILSIVAFQGDVEPFEVQFARLVAEDPAVRGRDAVIADCGTLMDDFPANRAPVALLIGRLFDLNNPTAGFVQDRASSMEWYEKARNFAELGTPVWAEASMRLTQRLREIREDVLNIQKSREILENLQSHVKRRSYEALVVSAELVYQGLAERDLERTERACEQLIEISTNSVSTPDGKLPPTLLVATALREYLINLAQAGDVPKRDRVERIQVFFDRHKNIVLLDRATETALKIVGTWKDDLEAPQPVPSQRIGIRFWLIVGNGVVVLMLTLAWLKSKVRIQRQPT